MSERRITIASVVEGEGDQAALPKVLYSIARNFSLSGADLDVPRPLIQPRGSLIAAGGIERAVSAMAQRVSGSAGGVLVLLDADEDCPAQLGPVLLGRARGARPDKLVSVVLAKVEFEAWFLAAASSLAGHHGFPVSLVPPDNPESIRDAKGWLTKHRVDGPPYKPTVDQAPLASAFDMKQAREGSPSFDKFCREVESLFSARRAGP
jgi:hypothetical protein